MYDYIKGTIEELKTNYNYLQFYVDPDTDAGESYGNQAGASAMGNYQALQG